MAQRPSNSGTSSPTGPRSTAYPAGVAGANAAADPPSPMLPDDLGASPVPPAPVIPDIPKPTLTSDTKLPRLLKATYITQGEKLLWESRPTRWFYLPIPTIVLALIIYLDGVLLQAAGLFTSSLIVPLPSALQAVAGSSASRIYEVVAVVLLLLAILFWGERWLRYASLVYVVTSTRVIRQKGILAKDFDEVQLLQIRGVDMKQHALQRVLGYGTIRISAEFGGTSQAMGNEDWPGVPRCLQFERTIEEGQERLRGILPPTVGTSAATRR